MSSPSASCWVGTVAGDALQPSHCGEAAGVDPQPTSGRDAWSSSFRSDTMTMVMLIDGRGDCSSVLLPSAPRDHMLPDDD